MSLRGFRVEELLPRELAKMRALAARVLAGCGEPGKDEWEEISGFALHVRRPTTDEEMEEIKRLHPTPLPCE